MLFEVPGWSLGAPKTEAEKQPKPKPDASLKKNSTAERVSDTPLHNKRPAKDGPALKKHPAGNAQKKQQKPSLVRVEKSRTSSAPLASSAASAGKSKLQQKMEEKLLGARFRFLNQKLYQSSSAEALKYFQDHPEDFDHYHRGFRSQVEHWPVNPVDSFVSQLEKELQARRHLKLVVADMGCGEAQIMRTFAENVRLRNRITVHSFDLAASHPGVVVCDMNRVPLPDASTDIVIFSLSLMNTNFVDALREARRILRPKHGMLRIAEIESRFDGGPDAFVQTVETLGFKLRRQDTSNRVFLLFEFATAAPSSDSENTTAVLKPCLYKKR